MYVGGRKGNARSAEAYFGSKRKMGAIGTFLRKLGLTKETPRDFNKIINLHPHEYKKEQ